MVSDDPDDPMEDIDWLVIIGWLVGGILFWCAIMAGLHGLWKVVRG
jgi:hypothetical protein